MEYHDWNMAHRSWLISPFDLHFTPEIMIDTAQGEFSSRSQQGEIRSSLLEHPCFLVNRTIFMHFPLYIYIIYMCFFWAFVSHRGTPKFSILDWDFPWNQPSSWGYPPWLWKPSFGNGSKVKTPQGQIGLNSTIQLLGYPIPQWPFQEPIHWRYRFRIFQAYFSGRFFSICRIFPQYGQKSGTLWYPYPMCTPWGAPRSWTRRTSGSARSKRSAKRSWRCRRSHRDRFMIGKSTWQIYR